MSTNDKPALVASKPVSVWKKPVQLLPAKFVGALAKGIFDVATGGYRDAGTDVEQAIEALGLKNEPEELAWKLVTRALLRAVFELIDEVEPFAPDATLPTREDFNEKLANALETTELAIECDFFDRPGDLALFEVLREPLDGWLRAHGAPAPEARAIVTRLPSYFTYALHQEWRERGGEYAALVDALDNKFAKARERERAWQRYAARLQKQINEPMFGEAFGLAQVYVPLCGYYEVGIEKPHPGAEPYEFAANQKIKRYVVELEDELIRWATSPTQDEPKMRVIAGGPGSGKSSLARMFAAKVSAKGVLVLYVPLHLIDPEKDVESAIDTFVRQQDILPKADSVFDEKRLLLLLDGLDELAMAGKASADIAKKFVDAVDRLLANRNHSELKLQALLGGRDVVVDLCRDILRKPGQVLHLLTYWIPWNAQWEYEDPAGLLREDRRCRWWTGYGAAKGNSYERMPFQLAREDLNEITAQPLLGYLVALSFEAGKLNLSTNAHETLNEVYQNLIGEVHRRTYAGKPHPGVERIELSVFVRLLEEVGAVTWRSGGRTASLGAIVASCEKSGLSKWLKSFEATMESGATRLLTAFYFRLSGNSAPGEGAFEFTHKSFGEFLTAGRIVKAVARMDAETKRRREDPESGWSERDALRYWAEICGPSAMDKHIVAFVRGEVARRGRDVAVAWQTLLVDLISYLLAHGMPMEALVPRPSYADEQRQSRNAEEALLACLRACAEETRLTSSIKWPDKTSFGTWIRRLQAQRATTETTLALRSLAWLDLGGQIIFMADLERAWLGSAILADVDLHSAILEGANLGGANLERANLRSAILRSANLEGANLQGANLQGVNLYEAKLAGASLQGANLERAGLERAKLGGASLEGANLEGARLSRAQLQGASFENANLTNAHLRNAELKGANLQGTAIKCADLSDAGLVGASLQGANLEDAVLEGAMLKGATLEGATLKGANFSHANLANANLRGVNLNGVVLAHASLQGANLIGANLEGATLKGVNLQSANYDPAALAKARVTPILK